MKLNINVFYDRCKMSTAFYFSSPFGKQENIIIIIIINISFYFIDLWKIDYGWLL